MRLLLTGSTGFVGRNLLLQVLKSQAYEEILLPVRSEKKLRRQLEAEGFPVLPSSLKPLEMEAPHWDFQELGNIEHVVHGAGLLFGNSPQEYLNTNTEGTLNLVRSLRNTQKIVILSSQAASGPCRVSQECKNESDTDLPITWYGHSKLEMERRLKAEFSELNFVFLRPPMILGARDTATLPLFKMAKGLVQFKPGFTPKAYSFIAVNDLTRAIQIALNEKSLDRTSELKHYFVSHEKPITDLELIQTASRLLGQKSRIIQLPQTFLKGVSRIVDAVPAWRQAVPSLSKDRAKEIWPDRWVVSPLAFQTNYGWKAEEGLQQALQSTLDWYRKTSEI